MVEDGDGELNRSRLVHLVASSLALVQNLRKENSCWRALWSIDIQNSFLQ